MALPVIATELIAKGVQGAKHWILTTVRVLVVIGVIALIGWSLYVTIIRPHTKPNPTTTENANIIYHFTINVPAKRVFGLGGTLWGADIGIVKYDWTTITTTIVKEITQIDPSIDTNTIISKVKEKVMDKVNKVKEKKWYFLWLL
jgi:hypothetical protein